MAGEAGFRLGIDFGTSHTTAVLRWPDGEVRPLLFDGSPLLLSAVWVGADGRLIVGRDAIHASRMDPTRFEPTPKRRIHDRSVLLGESEVTVSALVAAVLRRVRDEVVRVCGEPDTIDLTLTHPAGWGPTRRLVLSEAASQAGFPEPRLVPEPLAAASYFVEVLGRRIPPGSALVVYDFGGGTFNASAVAAGKEFYDVLAVDGLDDVGGIDLDAALLDHFIRIHRDENPQGWQRLENPQTAEDRRHRRHLGEDVRGAKETLSRATSASVPVPLLELEAAITRDEFEAVARPLLERTVRTTTAVIRWAGLRPEHVAAVLLVGGSSRIPLVADLLHRATGIAPAAIDQPETVIAEGSVRLDSGGGGRAPAVGAAPPLRESTGEQVLPLQAHPAQPVVARAVSAQQLPVRPMPFDQLAPKPMPVKPIPIEASPFTPPALPPLSAPVDPWASRSDLTPAPPGPADEVPTYRLPAPPSAPRSPYPSVPRSSYDDRGRGQQYQGSLVNGRRRRWLPTALTLVAVLAVAATGVILLPRLIGDNPPGNPATTFAANRTTPTQTEKIPYVRQERPPWVPPAFRLVLDDRSTALVVEGDATNGGTCRYTRAEVLRVQRDTSGVSGCVGTQKVKDTVVLSAAIEAEVSVSKGCAGMWMRTGTRGYFLAICADGVVQLHELSETDPNEGTTLRSWRPDFKAERVVVGLLAVGPELTAIIDGVAQEAVADASLAFGRVAMGGFAPGAEGLDATFTRFRAWQLEASGPSAS
jgi:hypothetical protein